MDKILKNKMAAKKHFKYRTRLASTNGVKINIKVTKELSYDSYQNFLYRFSQHWNELPIDLRQTQDIKTFKKNFTEMVAALA